MSKILFIGVLDENTGYGVASRNYLKALNRTGHDIVARSIKPNPNSPNFNQDEEIAELLSTSSKECEINIQHMLPHMMGYNGNFKKNIGIFVTESHNWWHSGWCRYLNQMDELWVPNNGMLNESKENKITIPVELVPHAFDITKYNKKYPSLNIPEIQNTFNFYFIGEHTRRKRISAFIEAFHLAFNRNEPVSCVIKTSQSGRNPNQTRDEIIKISNEIRNGLKLYPSNDMYLPEIIITEYLTEEQLYGLHQDCHCFVSASFGEAWNISAFEAMAFENSVIHNNCSGGPTDYLKDYINGYLINSQEVPIIGANDTFQFLNGGRENWNSIDILELSQKMRHVYDNRNNRSANPKFKGKNIIMNYSYENVGKIMKGIL